MKEYKGMHKKKTDPTKHPTYKTGFQLIKMFPKEWLQNVFETKAQRDTWILIKPKPHYGPSLYHGTAEFTNLSSTIFPLCQTNSEQQLFFDSPFSVGGALSFNVSCYKKKN